jgi:asparagine synthase (glutamine-hydrolysing)
MPGLFGIATTAGAPDAASRFEAGVARLARHGGVRTEVVSGREGSWKFGRVALTHDPHVTGAADAALVLFHGDAYNEQALRAEAGVGTDVGLSSVLAALYARRQESFIPAIDGAFALAIADTGRRRLILATDIVGGYPIYWARSRDGLVFGSDLSAVRRAMGGVARLDLEADADYLTFGTVIGEKTLIADVKLLPPASILVFDEQAGSVSVQPYLDHAELFVPGGISRDEYHESVQSAFTNAIQRATSGSRQLGLSLSGGLDSRALLSGINGHSGSLLTYTLGVDGCADQVIAEELSRIAGTKHVFFELNDSYLRDFLPNLSRMVSATDGMYLSHGLTEILAIDFVAGTGIEVLLRGHGGELAKSNLAWPLHTDPQVYAMTSLSELAPYLATRANYITRTLSLEQLLTPAAGRLAGRGVVDSFASSLAGKSLSPAAGASYLYLRELTRRFTVPSIELFRTRVDVRMPYLDAEFLRALLGAPPEWREGTGLHQMLTAAGRSALLKVRNSNTGAPGDASPTVEYVLDKMNSLMKRLNVRGYRHYHSFDAWMRTMLLQHVESELLRPDAKVQAFIASGTLRRVIEETRSGAADHAYLLQILLILELWQRENEVEAAA